MTSPCLAQAIPLRTAHVIALHSPPTNNRRPPRPRPAVSASSAPSTPYPENTAPRLPTPSNILSIGNAERPLYLHPPYVMCPHAPVGPAEEKNRQTRAREQRLKIKRLRIKIKRFGSARSPLAARRLDPSPPSPRPRVRASPARLNNSRLRE
ncbi:hypothetical protein HETIRDRAFT_456418 [Heterobasidion irregulare TC 32-1]|uniref:Uncharacterized protein n=1 Tax=Heterobasidion irregulare (strain TC 32-1) TaxID=747525 RepID=W4JN06_HETIT|nr:uncharacterized protein HETIRDRAFT_456418 [Heterobasidion irregulare TC 32-1]ETW74918.1 hypothetical protein HETIRDRAFT_456418 [Heterobasidion irregulare TC 32-1]